MQQTFKNWDATCRIHIHGVWNVWINYFGKNTQKRACLIKKQMLLKTLLLNCIVGHVKSHVGLKYFKVILIEKAIVQITLNYSYIYFDSGVKKLLFSSWKPNLRYLRYFSVYRCLDHKIYLGFPKHSKHPVYNKGGVEIFIDIDAFCDT